MANPEDVTPEQRAEFRKHVSQFVQRLYKGTFPDKEASFRSDSEGFSNCLEPPALGIIFAFRDKNRREEWSIVAQQSGVVRPQILINKLSYAVAHARRGKSHTLSILMPNLGEGRQAEAITASADQAGAERARQIFSAGTGESSGSANPSSGIPSTTESPKIKKEKR